MASATQIPELPDDEVALIFKINDLTFNRCVLLGMMHGIYTCIFLQTVWIVCVSHREKYQTRVGRKFMLAIIIALYILGTISTAVNWAFTRYSFITHGQNFWTIYSAFYNVSTVKQQASTFLMIENVAPAITGGLQGILVDAAMIWRCWTVWGCRWSVVVVPIICMVAGIVAKVLLEYGQIGSLLNANDPENFQPPSVDWAMVYLALSLAVTLLCTILIVFRIVTVGRANRDAALGGYRSIIEIIVESSTLLSIILIIYMVTYARGAYAEIYIDVIAGNIRGIAPTLIVGRVASGHARPDDAWKGSVLSSLHFGTRNHAQTQASTQYGDQRNTTYGFEDGTPDDSLGESKPATEGV
ncbi:hypothetical protein ARMSODRAFT_961588 [Armillaria solidipes]|uniref:Uncharacterized protein n=1 Tax=Armillaria solidipes TaxID=1076256 RepID=A0A2H3BPN4_9AGAR|nr:hypothetical protein ARMSODRAFT_961588 [Armillaria solidipes]